MSIGEIVFIGWSLLMVITAGGFFIWAWKSGQFKHVEKAKYDMLKEKEPLPWPGREGKHKDNDQSNPASKERGDEL
jgi:cbb3-type cytochrome oxidase maturation protein